MIAIVLNILKILGILLLALLGIALLLILLVLFIPVRYTLSGQKTSKQEAALSLRLKATWLLHILNMRFDYPHAAYLRVRIFCFTVFRSDRKASSTKKSKSEKESAVKTKPEEKNVRTEPASTEQITEKPDGADPPKENIQESCRTSKERASASPEHLTEPKNAQAEKEKEEEPTKRSFFKKLIFLLKNIKYTITKICDKIKYIVKNIKYYLEILRSDSFKSAFAVCKTQIFSLLKSVRPRKIKGSLLIGTGDPASTGQVLAAYGMLYPLIGNNIAVTPDFENQIIEGDLFVKGKITVFRLLKTAWIIFFNKDIRRVIKLLKREAA